MKLGDIIFCNSKYRESYFCIIVKDLEAKNKPRFKVFYSDGRIIEETIFSFLLKNVSKGYWEYK